MDWNRRNCARKGHITYAPAEPDLRARLRTDTAVGEAWRCLRCGDFVLGEPRGSGPAVAAPRVLRGRALRDKLVLRLLSLERLIRGVVLAFAAWGIWIFGDNQDYYQQLLDRDLTAIRPVAQHFNYNLDSSSIVRTLHSAFGHAPSTYHWVAIGVGVYGLMELVEGVGLWMMKRWAEYFTVFATALFVPLEVKDLIDKITWLRIVAFVINVAALVYLIVAKRLFGVRGGARAAEAASKEESLLEVESAADVGVIPHERPPAPDYPAFPPYPAFPQAQANPVHPPPSGYVP